MLLPPSFYKINTLKTNTNFQTSFAILKKDFNKLKDLIKVTALTIKDLDKDQKGYKNLRKETAIKAFLKSLPIFYKFLKRLLKSGANADSIREIVIKQQHQVV